MLENENVSMPSLSNCQCCGEFEPHCDASAPRPIREAHLASYGLLDLIRLLDVVVVATIVVLQVGTVLAMVLQAEHGGVAGL